MAVESSTRKVRRLCDPFGGSGTSGLAAQFMGIESVSIEVNPFLVDLIAAKVANYDVRELLNALPRVARRAQVSDKRVDSFFSTLPQTFIEPGRFGRWLFDAEVAYEIAKICHSINREKDAIVRRLLTVLLAGNLIEFSNAIVSGKGRRYRRGWETRRTDPGAVLSRFCDAVARAIVEIDAHKKKSSATATVIQGDSRKLIRDVGPVDLVVCSPPYPNSFDYTDVYNIELWMLGYLRSPQENQTLRRSTLSSHVQVRREFSAPPKTPSISKVLRKLAKVRDKLWDRKLVEMVGGYFADLNILLEGSADILRPKGQVWLVVGDSQYAGVRVPVAQTITEMAPSMGLQVRRQEPFRSMRLSPQQGGSQQLAESLVILSKK